MKSQSLHGWAMFKNGKVYNCMLEKTKRSLLIGYDLMPLRGLPETEKFLSSKGYQVMRATARIVHEGEKFDAIIPVVNGQLIPELLSYASWTPEIERTLVSAALYFSDRLPVSGEVNQRALSKFFWTPRHQKKRRQQRAVKAQKALENCGITFAPIVIEPASTTETQE